MSRRIIGAAIEVHKVLGPGYRERAYQEALSHELALRAIPHEVEYPLPLEYKGVPLSVGHRVDLWVDRRVVVELKAVDALHDVHEAQLRSYLRLTGSRLGLLMNFNAETLKSGLRRIAL